jgi:hypothetical protein
MTQIEWRSNNSKQLVAFENSKPLSDFNQPDQQAKDWVKNLNIDSGTEAICLVGCGSGFQIEHLVTAYPQLKIYIIESRPALIGFFAKKYKTVNFLFVEKIESLKNVEIIEFLISPKVEKLIFKPSLGHQSEILEEVYWFLNLRTYEALSYHLSKKIDGNPQVLIGAKQLIQNVGPDYKYYKTSEILTLKEIIKC